MLRAQAMLDTNNLLLVTATWTGGGTAALKVFVPAQHPSPVGSHESVQGQPTSQLPTRHCPATVSVINL
jgi:hypothetical protein